MTKRFVWIGPTGDTPPPVGWTEHNVTEFTSPGRLSDEVIDSLKRQGLIKEVIIGKKKGGDE